MKRDLITSVLGVIVLTALLGLAYPLLVTGLSQLAFPDESNGSKVERNGKVVGSSLIGQDFGTQPGLFHSRPSATRYAANATAFSNLGPNSRDLAVAIAANADAYLALERPYNPDLTRADIPPDAVQTSGSNVDPHISEANARIQAPRVARVRGIPLERVHELIAEHTAGRFLGVLGEPGVNVLELNLAIDMEDRQ